MTVGDGLVLRLKRILPGARATVYRALSDPGALARWWGPRGFTAPIVEFDPRVGGGYRIAMQPPDGDLFYLSGEFREVDPPSRLAYTFRWYPSDPDDRETVVMLSLQDRGERTEVGAGRVRHGGTPRAPRRRLERQFLAAGAGAQRLRGRGRLAGRRKTRLSRYLHPVTPPARTRVVASVSRKRLGEEGPPHPQRPRRSQNECSHRHDSQRRGHREAVRDAGSDHGAAGAGEVPVPRAPAGSTARITVRRSRAFTPRAGRTPPAARSL